MKKEVVEDGDKGDGNSGIGEVFWGDDWPEGDPSEGVEEIHLIGYEQGKLDGDDGESRKGECGTDERRD